ncbi:MAG: hypothetical protein HY880_06320 [Deltaproteobacteria bacterium]|nr:hypothetical protein [Deltaproteobacteria bacterium]
MKIAISVKDDLFREVEAFARDQHCSRSEVFSTAAVEFLKKVKSRQILKGLNDAYPDMETVEETTLREKVKKHYGTRVLKEKY